MTRGRPKNTVHQIAYLAVTFPVPWPGRHDHRFVFAWVAPKRLGTHGYWCQVLITRWYAFHLLLKPCRTLRCRRCRLNSSACARSPYSVTGRAACGTVPGWAGSLSCSYARLSSSEANICLCDRDDDGK